MVDSTVQISKSLLIFFFQRGLLLSVDERGVLNSPTLMCVCFSPFNSVIFLPLLSSSSVIRGYDR